MLHREGRNAYGVTWMCRCDCGKTKLVAMMNLRGRKTLSCGCNTARLKSEANRRHGCAGIFSSPLEKRAHSAWTAMRRRCYDPKFIAYPNYGGRGISVCEQWRESGGFERFLADMGMPPTAGHTIERRDSNGNYGPDNCRWATQKEQCRNTRATVFLTIGEITQPLWAWAESTGIDYHCIHGRIRRGLTGAALIK